MTVSSISAATSALAQAPASPPTDTRAVGENFGEQLLQLLLAGDAPAAVGEPSKVPKSAEKTGEEAPTEDDSEMPLLPGLSLLIQQMTRLDASADASGEASDASSTMGACTSGLMDLLEQVAVSASANDDSAAGIGMFDTTALSALTQPQQPMPIAAPVADANVAPTLSTPLPAAHTERLAEALDEQITWLADAARKDGPQQATISLHPAEWGSLQIRVDLAQDGRTTVKFDCETPQARQAIESSLSQLRELLSTTVVTGAAPRFELSGGFGHQASGSWKPATRAANAVDDGEPVESVSITQRPLGLLDQFA